jgi:protein involved in polysaccharide export with SLBB domain
MTIVDLVALAGGPSRQANERKMQLLRDGRSLRIPLDPATIGTSTLRELGVRSGDQLVMPRAFFTRDDLGLLLSIANFLLLAYTVVRK